MSNKISYAIINSMLKKATTFLKEVKAELLKVRWPTKEETIKMTLIVIGASIGVGILIAILDLIFTKLLGLII